MEAQKRSRGKGLFPSLHSALNGVGDRRHAPASLPPGKRPGVHCIGEGMGPRVGPEGCGNPRSPPGFDPRTVQPVVICYTDWAIPAQEMWSAGADLTATSSPPFIGISVWHRLKSVISCLFTHTVILCTELPLFVIRMHALYMSSYMCIWWKEIVSRHFCRLAADTKRAFFTDPLRGYGINSCWRICQIHQSCQRGITISSRRRPDFLRRIHFFLLFIFPHGLLRWRCLQ